MDARFPGAVGSSHECRQNCRAEGHMQWFSEHSGFAASGSAASQTTPAAPDKPEFDYWGSALHRLFMEGNPF